MKALQKITTLLLILQISQELFAIDAKVPNHFAHGPILAQARVSPAAKTSQTSGTKNKLSVKYRTIRSIRDIQDGDYFTLYNKEAKAYCWNDTQNKGISCNLKKPHIGAHFQVNRKAGARYFSLVGYDLFKANTYNRYCGIAKGANVWRCDSKGMVFTKLPGYGYRVGADCDYKPKHYINFSPDHNTPVLRPSVAVMEDYCKRRCVETPGCSGFQMETSNFCNSNPRGSGKRSDTQYQCGCKMIMNDPGGKGGYVATNFYKSTSDLPSTLFLNTTVYAPNHAGEHDFLKLSKAPGSTDAVILKSYLANQPLYFDSEDKEEVVVNRQEASSWDVYPFKKSDYTEEQYVDYPGNDLRTLKGDLGHCEDECDKIGNCMGIYFKDPQSCFLKMGKSHKKSAKGDFYTKQLTFEHDAIGVGPINIIGEQDKKYGKTALSNFDDKACRSLCNSKSECNVYVSNGNYCALYRSLKTGKGHHYHPQATITGRLKDLKVYSKVHTRKNSFDKNDLKYHFVLRKMMGEGRSDITSKKDKIIKLAINALKSKSRSKVKIAVDGPCHPTKVKDLFQYSKCFKFDPNTQLVSPPSQRVTTEQVLSSNTQPPQSYCTFVEKPSVPLESLSDDQILLMSETSPVIYPGSFVFANTRILSGDPAPVVVRAKRAPYVVSIENMTGIQSTTIEVDPSKGGEGAQIQAGLNRALNEAFESGASSAGSLSFDVKEVSSAEEMAMHIGVSVTAPMVEAEASFGMKKNSETKTFVAKISQSFYSLKYQPDTNLMNIYPEVKKTNALLWDDFLSTVGVGGTAEPIAAVTSQNYGSMLVAIIKSTKSLDEIEAEVKVKVGGSGGGGGGGGDDDDDDDDEKKEGEEGEKKEGEGEKKEGEGEKKEGGGAPAAGFGGSASAGFKNKKTSGDTQITLKGFGLSGSAAKLCVEASGDFDLLKKCMAAMVGFSKTNPGALLSYNVQYVIGRDINNGSLLAGQKVHRIQMSRGGLERVCYRMTPNKKLPCGQRLLAKTCGINKGAFEYNTTNSQQIARFKQKKYATDPTKCQQLCEENKDCYSWKASWPKLSGGKILPGSDTTNYGCYLYRKGAGDIGTKPAQYTVGQCNTPYPKNSVPIAKKDQGKDVPLDWVDVKDLSDTSSKIMAEFTQDSRLWWWSSKCHSCPAKWYKGHHKEACWNGTKTVTWNKEQYKLSNGKVHGDSEKGCGVAGCRARCRPTKAEKKVPKW